MKEMVDDVLGPGLYTNVRLANDRDTGRSRGFGHIDFKDGESADRAIAELNGLEVLGRELRADKATPGGGKPGGAREGGGDRRSSSSGRGGRDNRYGGSGGGDTSFGAW